MHDLAQRYTNADKVKEEMAKCFPLEDWQVLADNYDLPVSRIGYIARHILTPKHKSLNVVTKFLETHYAMRKAQAQPRKQKRRNRSSIS